MKRYLILAVLNIALIFCSCGEQYSKPLFVATSQPIAAIMQEIVGTKGEVMRLVPPGVSPHVFSIKVSDAYKVQAAKALIFTSEHLDGWAAKLESQNSIALFSLLPEEQRMMFDEEHSGHGHHMKEDEHDHAAAETEADSTLHPDPHFWTDPLTVKALIPLLVDTLSKIDPDNAATYNNNGQIFMKRLDVLHRQIENMLSDIKGQPVFLYHPSFRYFLKRYGLIYMGSIETSPEKEPTPQYLLELSKKVLSSGTKALFTEPQIPQSAINALAEVVKLKIYTLDPVGGGEGMKNYTEIMMYNTRIFIEALGE